MCLLRTINVHKEKNVDLTMPGYVPPALRNKPNYEPKKLSLKPKPIEYDKLKTKQELYEEYRQTNYGKADFAWEN
jgi:hypothetical protein